MTNSASLQKNNGRHLWFCLLGLGFDPDLDTYLQNGKKHISKKHINLGVSMFDKPNKEASYIVTHFLLEKLNPTRCHEAYRHCWPIMDIKADAEFRKVTCSWLREIMDKSAIAGSKVVASLFLSPGGPKFISLMLNLAHCVIQQEMKTFATDGSWAPETAKKPSSTLDMAVKRFNLTCARFVKVAADQGRFLLEDQRRTQHLIKSMREIKAEGAKYDELLKHLSSDALQDDVSIAEKTKKVRSTWATIDEMLSAIKEEQNALECVLNGEVDQYTLDGTDRVLKIPRCLMERIEQLPHQLSSGNVYKDGQLNLLCVMEVLNHALLFLKEERQQVSHIHKVPLKSEQLHEKYNQMSGMLRELIFIRQRVSNEEIPKIRSGIKELEANWDQKWMDVLKETPLGTFLNEDPTLGLLSPMAPLSFEPASEATYRNSVFSQFPATLSEEKPAELQTLSPSKTPAGKPESVSATTETPRPNTPLNRLSNMPAPTPLKTPSMPPPPASVRKTARVHWKGVPTKSKTEILDMEYENLAGQFADAITTGGGPDGGAKGLDLDNILQTLEKDPFSTRKQLPRTPESLILDVKSSWRKALKEDEAKKAEVTEVNDSIMQHLSPLSKKNEVFADPNVLHKSSFSWDTFSSAPAAMDSTPLFSLLCETIPEMPSSDSLLSLDDNLENVKEEELLIPSLAVQRPPMALNDDIVAQRTRTPECLMSDYTESGFDRDWLMKPKPAAEASEKVFSLDLEKLEMPSPIQKQEYSLPQLITFSPIDDMKC